MRDARGLAIAYRCKFPATIARAQTVEQHQSDQGQIACRAGDRTEKGPPIRRPAARSRAGTFSYRWAATATICPAPVRTRRPLMEAQGRSCQRTSAYATPSTAMRSANWLVTRPACCAITTAPASPPYCRRIRRELTSPIAQTASKPIHSGRIPPDPSNQTRPQHPPQHPITSRGSELLVQRYRARISSHFGDGIGNSVGGRINFGDR